MKKYHILVVSLLVFSSVSAQEVVASGGNSHSNANGSIDYTIGETVIFTGTDGSNDVTQGFQQTNWNFAGIEDHSPDFEVTIYPNPMQDALNINATEHEGITFKLFDGNGKLVSEGALVEDVTSISTSHLAPGKYSVSLYQSSASPLKTFKLIKQQ